MSCPCFCRFLTEFRESGHCSQDSMREDSFVSSTGPDQYSETAIFSGSDSDTQGPHTPSQDQPPHTVLSDSEQPPAPLELPSSEENQVNCSPSEENISVSTELHTDADELPTVSEPVEEPVEEVQTASVQESVQEDAQPLQEKKEETLQKSTSEPSVPSVHQGPCRSISILSRKSSTDSLSVSIWTKSFQL